MLGRVALYVTHCGLFCVMAALPSLPVVPGTIGPSYVGEPSIVVAPGTWALTSARPERAAAMVIVEYILLLLAKREC